MSEREADHGECERCGRPVWSHTRAMGHEGMRGLALHADCADAELTRLRTELADIRDALTLHAGENVAEVAREIGDHVRTLTKGAQAEKRRADEAEARVRVLEAGLREIETADRCRAPLYEGHCACGYRPQAIASDTLFRARAKQPDPSRGDREGES